MDPDAGNQKGSREELFQDMDPKALAAVLLQALQITPQNSKELPLSPKPSANEERVQSETKGSDVQPGRQQGWQPRDQPQEEEAKEAAESISDGREMESLKSMLKELQHYSPTSKREEPSHSRPTSPSEPSQGTHPDDMLKELEEYQQLKSNIKRKAPLHESWAGARKLRQQQHLEHQLLQRRYEELAESRRQAEEARRAAAEEERLADMASDLLLQYLLKDGEEDEEGQQGANAQEESEEEGSKGTSLLFEDVEDNVAEDKRSNETPEVEDDEDIDPNTIDRLIELSSKLHLPADDVIDIINDVEKKKKEEVPESNSKSKLLVAPLHSKPKKTPPYPSAHQEAHPIPKAFYPTAFQSYHHLPKQEEAAWNEVLKGNEFPAPKRYQAKDRSTKISNHISPRTFQTPVYHHYHHLPGPMVPRDGYYDIQAHDEDLENYLESLLMKHPKVF
ncbi:neurosecretory protein VGF [Python bivittatus]|uniref:Neurosecretory protein VGF n=1 Tax=Python bivittatus TaxID=176946 RepID=A0A9F5N5T2_PYTBI|nr:neurosecretory protein VGF [Python bivittatus]